MSGSKIVHSTLRMLTVVGSVGQVGLVEMLGLVGMVVQLVWVLCNQDKSKTYASLSISSINMPPAC